MSKWRGFVTESKDYCAYDGKGLKGRLMFWAEFPRAFARFMFFTHVQPNLAKLKERKRT